MSANLRKEWPEPFGKLYAEAGATYVGSRYFSTVNEPAVLAPAYATGNVRVGYVSPDEKWRSTLSVNNINDKAYQVFLFDEASIAGSGQQNVAPPRWVRWDLSYKW